MLRLKREMHENPGVLAAGNTEAVILLQTLQKSEQKNVEKTKEMELLFAAFLALNRSPLFSDADKIKLLIQASSSHNQGIRQQARMALSGRVASKEIDRYTSELYRALKLDAFFAALKRGDNIRPEYTDALPLIGRLRKLTPNEKNAIIDSAMIEPEIKAKLGDAKIEKTLIEHSFMKKITMPNVLWPDRLDILDPIMQSGLC